MKITNYRFDMRYFIISDGTTNHKRSKFFFKETNAFFSQTITVLLFFLSFHLHAQKFSKEPLERDFNTQIKTSIYDDERNELSKSIKQNSVTKTLNILSGTTKEKKILLGQDYFNSELFLMDDDGNRKIPQGHESNVQRYDSRTISFDNELNDNLTVYEISDKYAFREKNTNIDYRYDNTYYHFKDKDNITTSVYYITRTVGFLKSQYKIVNKGNSYTQYPLIVSPNPAKDLINITYQVERQEQSSLRIIDMNGRVVLLIFSNKQIPIGRYTVQQLITLPTGNYIVQFITGQKSSTQKLIVQ
ncbi:hypothetical protein CEY12_20575 [Chryseobacterium sp. T16E-39]|uniref:T9SS type A sorting domain-containing protein n=1 Tax=Chryseobacterium sp. T16E-39 TaxID=2015076 RepID=UPI000B5B1FB7|nr:T9SS type A sorting domain-containing protein [Chryseobacterium sp. T16E-39]ASK32329.1 hypothetical protein CEY12_20575 [Chryseobacterium sp. T16E-39]